MAPVLRQGAVGAVVPALSSEGVVLTFDAEDRVGDVVVRTVRVPCGLHEDCEVPVTVLSREGLDFWVAVAMGERDRGEVDALLEDERGAQAAAHMAVAFGLAWTELTISGLLGQFVLVSSIEAPTATLLGSLDVDALVQLRQCNPMPADVLRCLRLMREHGAATQ